jgi:hypothetical protein
MRKQYDPMKEDETARHPADRRANGLPASLKDL